MTLPTTAIQPSATLAVTLAAFRDHLIVQAEVMRANRAPDEPACTVRGPAAPFPSALLDQVLAFAAEPGCDLPHALASEINAVLDCASDVQRPLPRLDGSSERRAHISLGRARMLRKLFRANDLEVADRPMAEFVAASGSSASLTDEPIFRRQAVAVMVDVELENARRERGDYPAADRDPCLRLPTQTPVRDVSWTPQLSWHFMPGLAVTQSVEIAPLITASSSAAISLQALGSGSAPSFSDTSDRQPHGERQPSEPSVCESAPTVPAENAGPRISELMTRAIQAKQSSRAAQKTNKVLRDYAVARELFVELMGDFPISAITEEACEQFKDLLCSVPAMHGRDASFRGLTASESIAKADAADEQQDFKLATGTDPDTLRFHARLSPATVNKHLTSLQSCLGKGMARNADGKPPFIAVRFSKSEVRASPAFRRTELTDERVTAIFHGPVFTGFADAENRRFAPGQRLILDGCYWVPLLALFSGMCLEEALQLRPDDVATRDGISCISIGSIHDGQPARVKTAARVRTIPIHETLIELGFLEHVEQKRRVGETRIFPGLQRGGPDARFGHEFTQWWTAYRRSVGAYARGQDFHSLRHGVNRKLIKGKVPLPIVKRILGHSEGNDMNLATYFGEVDLADMRDGINAVSYPCLDLALLRERKRSLVAG